MKYILPSWGKAFEECNLQHMAYENTMRITNELFPLENGELRENWVGLDEESRNKVRKVVIDTL
jgi:hypothetical protein